jgi:hypothetical protein
MYFAQQPGFANARFACQHQERGLLAVQMMVE